jgi:hypothetical protein
MRPKTGVAGSIAEKIAALQPGVALPPGAKKNAGVFLKTML